MKKFPLFSSKEMTPAPSTRPSAVAIPARCWSLRKAVGNTSVARLATTAPAEMQRMKKEKEAAKALAKAAKAKEKKSKK